MHRKILLALALTFASTAASATIYQGTEAGDHLQGGTDSDEFYGRGGNDWLYGWYGNDRFEGGRGDDRLHGQYGSDDYFYFAGDGRDTINELKSEFAVDRLLFGPGIAPGAVAIRRSSDDLVMQLADGGSVLVQQAYRSGKELDEVRFADGTVWSSAQIRAWLIQGTDAAQTLTGYETGDLIDGLGGNDRISAAEGDDDLFGGDGDDQLAGDAGHDSLRGGRGLDIARGDAGSDTFFFTRVDFPATGLDRVSEPSAGVASDVDTLVLEDVVRSEVAVATCGSNICLRLAGGQGIEIIRWSGRHNIERVVFADGIVLTGADLDGLAP
jgi:Ca2+-binding RTX toxin-like protein